MEFYLRPNEGRLEQDMNNRTIAVIIDGEVVDVFRFDERTSAILLSNPTFIDISNISVETGWKFDGVGFTANIDGQNVTVPVS